MSIGRTPPALRTALTAAAGGLLLYAAFPPAGLWFLAPLGLALPALAVRGRSKRSAFMAGAVFGPAFFAPLIVWLANLGVLPWLALTAVHALIFGLAAIPLPRQLTLPGWPLFAAARWVAVEALRGRAPLGGRPRGRLGFSQADAPYAAWAAVGGAPLLTFVVACWARWRCTPSRPRAAGGAACWQASVPVRLRWWPCPLSCPPPPPQSGMPRWRSSRATCPGPVPWRSKPGWRAWPRTTRGRRPGWPPPCATAGLSAPTW